MSTFEFSRNYPSDATPSQLEWKEHLDHGPREFLQTLIGYAVWYNGSQRLISALGSAYINGVIQGASGTVFQGITWSRPGSSPEGVIKPMVQKLSGPMGTGSADSLQPYLTAIGGVAEYILQDSSFVTSSGSWNWTAPGGFDPPPRSIGTRWYNSTQEVRHQHFPVGMVTLNSYGVVPGTNCVINTSTAELVADIACSLQPINVSIRMTPTGTVNYANRYDKIGPNLWRATWQSITMGSISWPDTTMLIVAPRVGDTVGAVDLYRRFRTDRPALTGHLVASPSHGEAPLDVTGTVSMDNPIGALSYSWYVPDASPGNFGTDHPHDATFNGEGSFLMQVTVTDATLRTAVLGATITVEPGIPTALVEMAGEASSATSVHVQALPAMPVGMDTGEAAARLLGAAKRLGATPPMGVRIYQPRAVFDQEPWIVAGGRAEREPAAGVNAVTMAHARSYSTTAGIGAALSVTLGSTRRWVADPATFNTTTQLWSPSRGSTSVKFKGLVDGNQYIDPGYEYESRIGTLQRNAMIFPGRAWFTATGKMSGGTAWAIAMVFVVHANRDSNRATILNSFQDDPADPDNFQTATGLQDLCLDITGDKLTVRTGGRQTFDTLRTISDRPIIAVLSGTDRLTRLLVVDRKYVSHYFRHPDVGPTDMRFLLGRPNVEVTRRRGSARMDLMDLATWNSDLGPKQMWQVASKLDSVYGVSR